MAQAAAKKKRGRGCGKPAPKIPTVGEQAEPDWASTEPTRDDIAALGHLPQLSGWQARMVPQGRSYAELSSFVLTD